MSSMFTNTEILVALTIVALLIGGFWFLGYSLDMYPFNLKTKAKFRFSNLLQEEEAQIQLQYVPPSSSVSTVMNYNAATKTMTPSPMIIAIPAKYLIKINSTNIQDTLNDSTLFELLQGRDKTKVFFQVGTNDLKEVQNKLAIVETPKGNYLLL
jgi:hypothetical protein